MGRLARAAKGASLRVLGGIVAALRRLPWGIGAVGVTLTAISVVGGWFQFGFDAAFLFMPLAPIAWWGTRVVIVVATALLAWSLLRPLRSAWLYVPAQGLALLLTGSAFLGALSEAIPAVDHEIARMLPARYLFLLSLALGSQVWRMHAERVRTLAGVPAPRGRWSAAGAVLIALAGFLAVQFFALGGAARPGKADVIVVMGAAVLWDGRPSPPLAERIAAGCVLYRHGYADRILCSGGPVSPTYSEPRAMAAAARRVGVPPEVLLLDEAGVSTYATARSVRRIMAERGWRTVLIVTHEYHISRTWLAFRRAGVDACWFPAPRTRFRPVKDVIAVVREGIAWLYYYVRPLGDPLDRDPLLRPPHARHGCSRTSTDDHGPCCDAPRSFFN